jgi:hypothetical protein
MKRWTVLLGRIGTTVIAICLALLLVSLIPHAAVNGLQGLQYSSYSSNTWSTLSELVLTEPQTLSVNIAANGSLSVYVLEVSLSTVDKWINQTYPGTVDFSNVTYLDGFLSSHSDLIGWQGAIHNGTIAFEYAPTKIVDISLIASNHSPQAVYISNYGWVIFSNAAPVSKVRTLSEFAIPVGFVFILPWLSDQLKAKAKKMSRTRAKS